MDLEFNLAETALLIIVLFLVLGLLVFVVIVFAKAITNQKHVFSSFVTQHEHMHAIQSDTNQSINGYITAQKETNDVFLKFIEAARNDSKTLRQFLFQQQELIKIQEKKCDAHTVTTQKTKEQIEKVERKVTRLARKINVNPEELEDGHVS